MSNVRMNLNRITGLKRSRGTGNTPNRARKVVGREVEFPPLVIGRGMGCAYAGIPRYMKKAQQQFNNRGITSVFLDYDIPTNRFGMTKNIDRVVKSQGEPVLNTRIHALPNVHFFMVGMRTEEGGHAVSVLVDPKQKKIWVFDPHGAWSRQTIFGVTMRRKIVPIIKNMWKIPMYRVQYYNGVNLQDDDTRGTCSTYYVTFMNMIPYLLSGRGTMNDMEQFASMNSTQLRQFYLNFAPENAGRVIARNAA